MLNEVGMGGGTKSVEVVLTWVAYVLAILKVGMEAQKVPTPLKEERHEKSIRS